jgi:hypothetical protein
MARDSTGRQRHRQSSCLNRLPPCHADTLVSYLYSPYQMRYNAGS